MTMISPVDVPLPGFDAGVVGFLGFDVRVQSQKSARRNQRLTQQGEAKSRHGGSSSGLSYSRSALPPSRSELCTYAHAQVTFHKTCLLNATVTAIISAAVQIALEEAPVV